MTFSRFSSLERIDRSLWTGSFRRSFRRYVHSDESNLARRAGVWKQFRELIYGWHVVHIREQNQEIVRQPRNLRFMQGKLIHTVFSLRFSPLSHPFSLFLHPSFYRLVVLFEKFLWKIGFSRIPAQRDEEFSSRAFILLARYTRSSDAACLSAHRIVSSNRDVCDFIIIAIYGENLRFRTQSIRKFCLIMVITNPNCNLWPN